MHSGNVHEPSNSLGTFEIPRNSSHCPREGLSNNRSRKSDRIARTAAEFIAERVLYFSNRRLGRKSSQISWLEH